jgi:glycosyltransferase involved in cell wall biosynthesis
MAAGKAIVAEKVGQTKEYIIDGESGLLVIPDDIQGFASSIVRVLKDDAFRKRLCENSQKRILSNFYWSKLLENAKLNNIFAPE